MDVLTIASNEFIAGWKSFVHGGRGKGGGKCFNPFVCSGDPREVIVNM